MNKIETTKILAVLKVNYPSFYEKENNMEAVIDLWTELFKEYDYNLVSAVIKEIINTSEYPPTIATIKKKIYELTHIEKESPSELWERLLKAIRNGYYGAEKEFNELPDVVKEFLGSPQQLRSIAEMDSDTIHSVVKGQFLKQIENLQERIKQKEMMSNETRQLLFGENKKMIENK